MRWIQGSSNYRREESTVPRSLAPMWPVVSGTLAISFVSYIFPFTAGSLYPTGSCCPASPRDSRTLPYLALLIISCNADVVSPHAQSQISSIAVTRSDEGFCLTKSIPLLFFIEWHFLPCFKILQSCPGSWGENITALTPEAVFRQRLPSFNLTTSAGILSLDDNQRFGTPPDPWN